MNDPNPHFALTRLLLGMFSGDELRRLIRYLPDGDQLSADLPGATASLATLVDSAVITLERHGILSDESFFARLREERPRRTAEIDGIARLFQTTSRRVPEPSPPESHDRRMKHLRDDVLFGSERIFAPTADAVPVKVSVWSAAEDRDLRSQFDSAVAPLVRAGIIAIGDEPADIVCMLVTPGFLDLLAADPATFQSLTASASRRSRPVLPIVVRTCLWQATFLRDYTVLPRGDAAILSAANIDEAWRQVASTIAVFAHQRSWSSAHAHADTALGVSPVSEILPLYEVFTTGGMPTNTWVQTPHFHEVVQQLRRPAFGLIIEGSSGIGKTVTTKAALRELRQGPQHDWPERWIHIYDDANTAEVEDLLRRPPDTLTGHVVIDDFHRLDAGLRRRVGGYVRGLVEVGNSNAKITLIGINRAGEALIQHLPDLRQRAHTVAIKPQSDALIERMIALGETKLNVMLTRRAEIVVLSEGSFTLAQWMCELICQLAGVTETRPTPYVVDLPIERLMPRLLQGLGDQFHTALHEFACMDIDCATRGSGLALLWALSKSLDNSAFFHDVRGEFASIAGSFDELAARLPRLDGASWRQHIHHDRGTGQLSLVDPKLSFYLKYMDWRRFANLCGLQLVVITKDSLTFANITADPQRTAASPAAATRVEAGGDAVVRILHLSDFHFATATAWDAATCLGRLAVDIQRLRQQVGPPDIVVLSGDIANTGRAEEYAQARAWLEHALMPAAQVNASQIIPAPGNHDVDRGRTQSAIVRAAQNELLKAGKQEDVAALLAGEDADLLLRRHVAFVQFADAMRLGGIPWRHPWASFRRMIRGLSVHVAAFSSAWLAASDQDHGNLLLGLYQANLLLRDADSADLVVSVMHHPWAFFAAWDRPAQVEVQRISSLVLRGHLHDAGQQLIQSHAHDMVQELAAGAAYESSQQPNGYHLLEARPREGTLRIWPRFWDVRRREWRADRNLFDAEVHEVPLRRAPPTPT